MVQMGQNPAKYCIDCGNGPCHMNCGPALRPKAIAPNLCHRTEDGSLGTIEDANGHVVMQVQEISRADSLAGSPVRQATAARAALAYNCHDELVAALKEIDKWMGPEPVSEYPNVHDCGVRALIRAVKAALAKSRGRQ